MRVLVQMRVGYKKDTIHGGMPIIPMSGWFGDNLLHPSPNMQW